jgi:hypothetical protein
VDCQDAGDIRLRFVVESQGEVQGLRIIPCREAASIKIYRYSYNTRVRLPTRVTEVTAIIGRFDQ